MELVRELLFTAGVALIFSFIVAKLVSMAMAADSKPAMQVDDETIAEELKGEEKKLEVQGSVKGTGVQSVEETAEIVEKLEDNPVQADDALETRSEGGEVDVELKSEVKSGDIVEEKKVESPGVEEYVEELKDQIDFVSESQEIGVEVQSEGLVSVVEEEEQPVSDDDDWEGIERTELDKEFATAVKFVESLGNADSLGNDLLMDLYGLHKIATEGPCHESQPMALKVSARSKWNAWQKLGNMNPEKAMEQYILLLSDKVPQWTEGRLSEGDSKPEYCAESGQFGPTSTDMSSNPCTTTVARYSKCISAANNATGGSGVEDQVKD